MGASLPRVRVQTPRDLGRIHGLDDVENFGRFLRFVGLQMADEVVAGAGAIGQFSALLIELLHVVFAEVAQAELVGFANHRGRKFLGDRDQQNIGTLASGARGRAGDAGFHVV